MPTPPVVISTGASRWLREYLINYYTAEYAKADERKRATTAKHAALYVPLPIDITPELEPDLDALTRDIQRLTHSAATVQARAESIRATQILTDSALRPDTLKQDLAAMQRAARLRREAAEEEEADDLLLASHVL